MWVFIFKQWIFLIVLLASAITVVGVRAVQGRSESLGNPPEVKTISPSIVQVKVKRVVYEVFGSLGAKGRVTYANLASEPVEVELHSLPWSHTESTTDSGATLSLVAQVDGGSLGCRITVDNQVLDEQAVNHQNASVTCTVLAA